MDRAAYWENVYRTKGDADLSWHQERPAVSLSLIGAIRPAPSRVIDVGGGQSALAGALLEMGAESVTVLDISAAALERGRARLGPRAERVNWVVGDVLEHREPAPYDLWHDRAVFHFLTDPEDQRRYAGRAAEAVRPGGHLIVAAFAPSGPERCSGLPVQRHDAASLARAFAPGFAPVRSEAEAHGTPWGGRQDFVYCLFSRV